MNLSTRADASSVNPVLKYLGEFEDKEELISYNTPQQFAHHVVRKTNQAAVLHSMRVQVDEMSLLSGNQGR